MLIVSKNTFFFCITPCWLLLSAFLLSGCSRHEVKLLFSHEIMSTGVLQYDSILSDRPIDYTFINKSANNPVTFGFYKQGSVNMLSASSMLRSLVNDSMSDAQKSFAIWKFVSASGYHHDYDYNHSLPDHVDPISLVTFPYFMCGEKAGIIVNLANLSGFPAHSVGLDGHVVSEIWYDDAWHMFDADENCIFKNGDGVVLSVKDLHNQPKYVSEKNITYSLHDNFHGFGHYRDYIAHYKDSWVDTTSLIRDYSYPSTELTLYPGDELVFRSTATSWWYRLWYPRGPYSAQGIVRRKLNLHQKNMMIVNDTILFTESFPYYLTTLHISSQTPTRAKAYFLSENRITHKTEKSFLGTLDGGKVISKKTAAPVESDIYYKYTIVLENIKRSELGNVIIEHEFEYNALTFPLSHGGEKMVTLDTIGSKSLFLKITQK